MSKTCKIAAAVIRCVPALLAMPGGSGATAWMFLDDDGGD